MSSLDVLNQVAASQAGQAAAPAQAPGTSVVTGQPVSTPAMSSADVLAAVAKDPTFGQTPEGEQTNDIGKTVIVPKDGESFSDTMSRAVAQGKRTTQKDINDEVKTAPGKVAETLAAAAIPGAAAVAGPAVVGAVGSLTPAAIAVTKFVTDHPVLAGMAYHIAREAGVPLPKILDVLAKVKE